ncbi:cyclin-domain-containing protein [Catenaria anguillulae PL171]|uniref:Cyclin-domain-containing protein n=1 Tax=Catenaria anguillulae PL171 TaxID=765915 RepID=A0A1Y2I4M9_9FUNG|nr:cyclin-domain-containing protein [Catenaria anguillulae PL171]
MLSSSTLSPITESVRVPIPIPIPTSTPNKMTLNVLSYQHQHAYGPAPGMCQAAPALLHGANNNLPVPARLKRSATTISSAHRLRTRLMSQDPTTCSSAPSSASSTPSAPAKRPRSPAREALHASVSKHLTSARTVSRSSSFSSSTAATAAVSRSRSSSSTYSSTSSTSKPAATVPAAPAVAPVVPSGQHLANPHLIVATLLVRIAQANDSLLARASPLASTDRGAAALLAAASKFQGRAPPTISLPAYAARLARYAPVPAAVWVATLIAIDRVANAPTTSSVDGSTAVPPVVVCSHNVHRVLLLALAIATKVHSDAFYTNKHLAKVGGIGLAELNRLELEFLFLSGFNVNVSGAEYARYTDRLAAYANAVQQQWAAKTAALVGSDVMARGHSVDLVAHQRPGQQHDVHHKQQQQQQQHAKSAPAALGLLISPPCSPTPSCSSTSSASSTSSSCYSAGAVVCTAPGQRQVVWSTPPMSPPRHLMASDPMVLSPMAVDQRD